LIIGYGDGVPSPAVFPIHAYVEVICTSYLRSGIAEVTVSGPSWELTPPERLNAVPDVKMSILQIRAAVKILIDLYRAFVNELPLTVRPYSCRHPFLHRHGGYNRWVVVGV